VIRVTTPILFATMAVLLYDRAGVLNISIEGTMLFAALMGVVGSAYTQSAWLGLLSLYYQVFSMQDFIVFSFKTE
jgi:simple sugar transport system permease protein